MSYRTRHTRLSPFCILLAMLAFTNPALGEDLLKKAGDEYLGWKISENQFETCGKTTIDIGDGRVEKTTRKCPRPPPPGVEARWRGVIIRMDKDASTLDVRRTASEEKRIHYDSSTKWTERTKPSDMSKFKENVTVTCVGKYDEKGQFHATQIDLRHE